MFIRVQIAAVATILCVVSVACGGSSHPAATQTPANDGINFPNLPVVKGDVTSTPSGLRFVDLKVGSGATPSTGTTVKITYTGWLVTGDSFSQGPQPLTFTVGARQALPGLDEAVSTMKVGGKRRAVLAPDLAFGDSGYTTADHLFQFIPPKATVIFDIELVEAK